MLEILPSLEKVKEKHQFVLVLLGFTGSPLDSEMYEYAKFEEWGIKSDKTKYQTEALKCYEYLKRMGVVHFPFYTPELYPLILANTINGDIGICPLEDNEFNKSKSCIKFYEYGACGMATIAPKMLPYESEVSYTYQNTNDFETKLIRLLNDKELRTNIAKEQRSWIIQNRDINDIAKLWKDILG